MMYGNERMKYGNASVGNVEISRLGKAREGTLIGAGIAGKDELYAPEVFVGGREELRDMLIKECEQYSERFKARIRWEEVGAMVTHFMQSPCKAQPLLEEGLRDRLMSILLYRGESVLYAREALPLVNTSPLFRDLPYALPEHETFTFIDLFAGIGGFRIAFQHAGGKCMFSSEWDKYAKRTYEANYGEIPYGDIRQIPKEQIPEHDVLCAGFPCQPFSLAGVSKKNSLGRKHGFEDKTQGTLFFEIKEILKLKRPKAFMLENVKNLLAHDRGRTFEVIRHALEDELGYVINYKVVDGAAWVPQHRERLYIIGFDPAQITINAGEIEIPDKPDPRYRYPELTTIVAEHAEGYTLGPGTWNTLQRHKKHHEEVGNGFGYGLLTWPIKEGTITRTISARYHKDGSEILIEQPGKRPRRLTVQEAMQLQGFSPRDFFFPVSQTQAYHQIGNSVVVPAVEASAKFIAWILKDKGEGYDSARGMREGDQVRSRRNGVARVAKRERRTEGA